MKTWKLVSGIISIILFGLVAFQSCAAGVSNTLSENGEVSGSAGILVAALLLAGGIVSVATRGGGKGGNIATLILFGLGALIGFMLAGNYTDLYLWSGWCLVCAVLALVCLVKKSPQVAPVVKTAKTTQAAQAVPVSTPKPESKDPAAHQ